MTTFNRITKGLQKTIKKLARLSEKNEAKMADHSAEIFTRQQDISALGAEAARAKTVAGKIADLIGA